MKVHWRYLLVYALLVLATVFMATHATHAVPVNRPLDEIPIQLGPWKMTRQTSFSPGILAQLRPTAYLARDYADAQGHTVTLYVGFHDGGPQSGPIHSPKHCLPGSGWHAVVEQTRPMEVAGQQFNVVQSVYAKGGSQDFFIYWYQVKGQVLTSEYALKIAEIRNSILHHRKDTAFIRISIPDAEPGGESTDLAYDFIARVFPHIKTALPM